MKLTTIEGIGESAAAKLKKAGCGTIEALRKQGKTPKGRKDLAAASGIAEGRILKWVNCADLMRINGVGEEYSELLEAAGVDTVKELKTRNVANLTEAMAKANAKKKLVRQLPSEKTVAKWVAHAKKLKPGITY